jgi:hypothetical protein
MVFDRGASIRFRETTGLAGRFRTRSPTLSRSAAATADVEGIVVYRNRKKTSAKSGDARHQSRENVPITRMARFIWAALRESTQYFSQREFFRDWIGTSE